MLYNIKSDKVARFMKGSDSAELKENLQQFGVEVRVLTMDDGVCLEIEGRVEKCVFVLELVMKMDERLFKASQAAVRRVIMAELGKRPRYR